MELLLFPYLCRFAEKHNFRIILAPYQNFYPDITFLDSDDDYFALDIKSTYRITSGRVNGMTLGAFTGYFRDRKSIKNIILPYSNYKAHIILGIIYSRTEQGIDEKRVFNIIELDSIASVVHSFEFFVQEKYKIASDRPGSGNTKNIGSITSIDELINGKGPFEKLGIEIFDDYWMSYLTSDMARAAELTKRPWTNIASYLTYRGRK